MFELTDGDAGEKGGKNDDGDDDDDRIGLYVLPEQVLARSSTKPLRLATDTKSSLILMLADARLCIS